MSDIAVAGTDQERKSFSEVFNHYSLAEEDLRSRIVDFDKRDILFRSYIDKNKWPYKAIFFDPRVSTILFEKAARTFANKPRGRMTPREGGDVLGAKINTELLSFQWDDNERVDSLPMLVKWILMYLNAKKYGASFGLAKWHFQRQVDSKTKKARIFYDGPNFKPWPNRDVLHNPAYSTVKNWIQLRDYPTFGELTDINDAARSKPIYKNLDILRDLLKREGKQGGDNRASNYQIKDKTIKGLQDYLGRDEVYKTIEVVTEYRPERWITFAPKHGLILRDIPNPYDHGQIPVVQLKFKQVDDDIYGLSEIESVEKLQNIINAVGSQYLDAINMSLYAPLKVRNTNGAVQMHTLQFGPGSKWLMNDPTTDVVTHQQNISGVREFLNTYRTLVSALQEAMGESSQGISNIDPGAQNKTATEIRDTAQSRSAMDNFDQVFLGEAMKKQAMFWFMMNQQFLFSNPNEQQKIIDITGKDAIRFFQTMGLDGEGLDDAGIEMLSDPNVAGTSVIPEDLMQPMFPVQTPDGGIDTKFSVEAGGQSGKLVIEPEDLSGSYDYIADIGSMGSEANFTEIKAKGDFLSRVTGVDPTTGQPTGIAGMMAQEGKKIKATDLLIDYAEDIGFKNADQYIESMQQQNPMIGGINGQIDPTTGQPINPAGAGGVQGMPNGMVAGGAQGMVAGGAPVLG